MKILKEITCLAFFLAVTITAFGQEDKGNRKMHQEKIQAMKVGYITEKIDLSAAEAQIFWPVYNAYSDKMEAIHRSIREAHKKGMSIDEMSDEAVEEMVRLHHQLRQKDLNTQEEYLLKFKKILSIKKVAKLYKAEHDFKRALLKKLKDKKGGAKELNTPPPHPENKN